jgi:hypothetical protein
MINISHTHTHTHTHTYTHTHTQTYDAFMYLLLTRDFISYYIHWEKVGLPFTF